MTAQREALRPQPDLPWSTSYPDPKTGDPIDRIGLIGYRIGSRGVRMDMHRRKDIYHGRHDAQDAVLIFGTPGRTKIIAHFEEQNLQLNGAHILAVMEQSQRFLGAIRKLGVAERAEKAAERLMRDLKLVLDTEVDPLVVESAGLLRQVGELKTKSIPAEIGTATAELVKLDVVKVSDYIERMTAAEYRMDHYSSEYPTQSSS